MKTLLFFLMVCSLPAFGQDEELQYDRGAVIRGMSDIRRSRWYSPDMSMLKEEAVF